MENVVPKPIPIFQFQAKFSFSLFGGEWHSVLGWTFGFQMPLHTPQCFSRESNTRSGICKSFMTPHFPSLPKSNESLLLLFSYQVMYSSFWSHGLQCARLSCLSLSPRVCPSSCPLHRWLHPTTKFYWIHSLYRQQLDPLLPSSVELTWGVSTFLLRIEQKPCFQIVPS